MIVGKVGADASGVAIGKNIAQTIHSMLGAPTPADKHIIEEKFAELDEAISKLKGQVDDTTLEMAAFQAKLLKGELTKTADEEEPSASTITQVGDWLLDSLPDIAEVVVSLFASPAVGKVVGKAGDIAVKWVKERFGS